MTGITLQKPVSAKLFCVPLPDVDPQPLNFQGAGLSHSNGGVGFGFTGFRVPVKDLYGFRV